MERGRGCPRLFAGRTHMRVFVDTLRRWVEPEKEARLVLELLRRVELRRAVRVHVLEPAGRPLAPRYYIIAVTRRGVTIHHGEHSRWMLVVTSRDEALYVAPRGVSARRYIRITQLALEYALGRIDADGYVEALHRLGLSPPWGHRYLAAAQA